MPGCTASDGCCLGALGAALALASRGGGISGARAGSWVAKDFKFHTGEVLPELKLGYTTVGAPTGEPVLMLQWHHRLGARAC